MAERKKIHLQVNSKFILEDSTKFWMVTSGRVEVFYVRINDNGEFITPLRYLYTAKDGDLLMSLITSQENESDLRILLISNEANILEINKNDMLEIDSFYLKEMLNKWILNTVDKICTQPVPRVFTSIEKFTNYSIKKGIIAYSPNKLVWGYLTKGKLKKFAGTKSDEFNDNLSFAIPISNKLWIESESDDLEISIYSTREILNDEINLMLSLNELQRYLYQTLDSNLKSNLEEDSSSINTKLNWEEKLLSNSLNELGNIVKKKIGNNKISHSENIEVTDNILFETCKLIGDSIGIDFKKPKHIESYENNTTNQLNAISNSSKVRFRKIILRGNWWKDENGHLLAFNKEDKRPVALIQKSSNKYILHDLTTHEVTPVNHEVAETLEPISYMFLPGFDKSLNSLTKILNFALKGVRKDSKFLVLAAISGSLLGLLVPVLSGVMFDDIIPTADKSLHIQIFLIMILIGFISAGLQLIRGVLQLRVETKSSINLQAGVMDHLLRLPTSFYNKFTSGDLTNRALSINAIRQILSNTILSTALTGAFSFVNLGLLFYYDVGLAWIGIGLALIAFLFSVGMGWLKLKYDRKINDVQGELQGFLFEFLSGITKIRITGGEKRVFSLWARKFSKLKKYGFMSGSYQNFVETFNNSYPLFTNILFFCFIYYTYTNSTDARGLISVGAFMAFITAFNQFLRDCLSMSLAFITSLNVISLYERVKPIMEEEPETFEGAIDPGELFGNIEMNSVSFRYHPDQPLVLKNINFKINAGEMVAFVGSSGSGKSTIMRLLLGFENPEIGSIFYDGDSFDDMNKECVRRQIGVVLQNGSLMSGSIYKNIVGNSELTLDDAWDAARMAGMEEDIKQMPMEMHTMVSEGAGTFSGGQRQRLMIARAIVHRPRMLYMDEATSALDNRTQNIVSESLEKLQATRIVIAHRLSTIKNADRIYVMENGEIIESGTYEELMENDGLFKELAKRQIA